MAIVLASRCESKSRISFEEGSNVETKELFEGPKGRFRYSSSGRRGGRGPIFSEVRALWLVHQPSNYMPLERASEKRGKPYYLPYL